MRRLTELAHEGIVGQPAPRHYSLMGYILDPTVLVEETAPAMSKRAGSTVAEVKGSHAVYVSQPQAVAAIITKAARGVALATR